MNDSDQVGLLKRVARTKHKIGKRNEIMRAWSDMALGKQTCLERALYSVTGQKQPREIRSRRVPAAQYIRGLVIVNREADPLTNMQVSGNRFARIYGHAPEQNRQP